MRSDIMMVCLWGVTGFDERLSSDFFITFFITLKGAAVSEIKRKMRFMDGNWGVFEEKEKAFVLHFCKPEAPVKGMKKSMMFARTVGWQQSPIDPKCEICGEAVPEGVAQMVLLRNSPL